MASTLNELATQSQVRIVIEEEAIPVRDEVFVACEMLGFDPLHVANEGKLIALVDPSAAGRVLAVMQENEYGEAAAIIGEVREKGSPRVVMKTRLGTSRLVDMLSGDLLPRI